jgi:magnesium transporter
MLAFYAIHNERLVPLDPKTDSEENAAWIDLLNPTYEEEAHAERLLGVGIPTRDEMVEIEVSSRLYSESDTLYMTAVLLVGGHAPMPQSEPVTFILTHKRLASVRYAEPSVFKSFVEQARRADSNLKDADAIFVALLEAIIDRTADILEKVGADMDAISTGIFQNEVEQGTASSDFKEQLRRLGRAGDLNSKVRESLVSIGRLVNFLTAECGDMHPDLRERTRTMSADIRSLADHASYVSGNTTFLLDALLGLINIEQNDIIRIVSVVSVLIMPPTLIASIYGMNFHFMPELSWPYGYPLAIVAMLAAALVPYAIFKRRGWL